MDLGQERKEGFILFRMVEKCLKKSLALLFVKGKNVVFKELDLFC